MTDNSENTTQLVENFPMSKEDIIGNFPMSKEDIIGNFSNGKITMKSPKGEIYIIPSEDVKFALSKGFQPFSPNMVDMRNSKGETYSIPEYDREEAIKKFGMNPVDNVVKKPLTSLSDIQSLSNDNSQPSTISPTNPQEPVRDFSGSPIVEGDNYLMKSPNGEIYKIPIKDEQKAIEKGFYPYTKDMKERDDVIKPISDNPLATFGANVATGLIPGLKPFIAATSPLAAKEMALQEEINPIAAISGDIVGTTLSSAFGPLGRLSTSVGGKVAGKITEKLGESGVSKFLSRSADIAAQNAVESAVFSTSDELTKKIIYEKDFDFNKIAKDVAVGTASGTALSAVGSGIGYVWGKTKPKLLNKFFKEEKAFINARKQKEILKNKVIKDNNEIKYTLNKLYKEFEDYAEYVNEQQYRDMLSKRISKLAKENPSPDKKGFFGKIFGNLKEKYGLGKDWGREPVIQGGVLPHPLTAYEIAKNKGLKDFGKFYGEDVLLVGEDAFTKAEFEEFEKLAPSIKYGASYIRYRKSGKELDKIIIHPEYAKENFRNTALKNTDLPIDVIERAVNSDDFLKTALYHEMIEKFGTVGFKNHGTMRSHVVAQVLMAEGGFVAATKNPDLIKLISSLRKVKPQEFKYFKKGFKSVWNDAKKLNKWTSDFGIYNKPPVSKTIVEQPYVSKFSKEEIEQAKQRMAKSRKNKIKNKIKIDEANQYDKTRIFNKMSYEDTVPAPMFKREKLSEEVSNAFNRIEKENTDDIPIFIDDTSYRRKPIVKKMFDDDDFQDYLNDLRYEISIDNLGAELYKENSQLIKKANEKISDFEKVVENRSKNLNEISLLSEKISEANKQRAAKVSKMLLNTPIISGSVIGFAKGGIAGGIIGSTIAGSASKVIKDTLLEPTIGKMLNTKTAGIILGHTGNFIDFAIENAEKLGKIQKFIKPITTFTILKRDDIGEIHDGLEYLDMNTYYNDLLSGYMEGGMDINQATELAQFQINKIDMLNKYIKTKSLTDNIDGQVNFSKLWNAVNNPEQAFLRMSVGIENKQDREVLQKLFPDMYNELKNKIKKIKEKENRFNKDKKNYTKPSTKNILMVQNIISQPENKKNSKKINNLQSTSLQNNKF